jgi:hypothetical protein
VSNDPAPGRAGATSGRAVARWRARGCGTPYLHGPHRWRRGHDGHPSAGDAGWGPSQPRRTRPLERGGLPGAHSRGRGPAKGSASLRAGARPGNYQCALGYRAI